MTALSIKTDGTQNIPVMRIAGRIDSDAAPELDEALMKILQENNKIVLNLQDVEYMSSAGLRAMVKAHQTAQKNGGDIRLACVPESVEGILLTVGMLQMLKAFPNDQEALASF